eukprot:759424-Hanusia_phi.AAC.2
MSSSNSSMGRDNDNACSEPVSCSTTATTDSSAKSSEVVADGLHVFSAHASSSGRGNDVSSNADTNLEGERHHAESSDGKSSRACRSHRETELDHLVVVLNMDRARLQKLSSQSKKRLLALANSIKYISMLQGLEGGSIDGKILPCISSAIGHRASHHPS